MRNTLGSIRAFHSLSSMNTDRRIERALAVASFTTAAALAFTSLLISEEHDIAANVLFVIAQFLVFAASILGIDYHFEGKLKHLINHGRDKK